MSQSEKSANADHSSEEPGQNLTIASESIEVQRSVAAKDTYSGSPIISEIEIIPTKPAPISEQVHAPVDNGKAEDPDAITPVLAHENSTDEKVKHILSLNNDSSESADEGLPLNDVKVPDNMINAVVDLRSLDQSKQDRKENLEEAKSLFIPKLHHEPENITKEDAALLQSREVRAHGEVQKGSLAAEAQHLADVNKS